MQDSPVEMGDRNLAAGGFRFQPGSLNLRLFDLLLFDDSADDIIGIFVVEYLYLFFQTEVFPHDDHVPRRFIQFLWSACLTSRSCSLIMLWVLSGCRPVFTVFAPTMISETGLYL